MFSKGTEGMEEDMDRKGERLDRMLLGLVGFCIGKVSLLMVKYGTEFTDVVVTAATSV